MSAGDSPPSSHEGAIAAARKLIRRARSLARGFGSAWRRRSLFSGSSDLSDHHVVDFNREAASIAPADYAEGRLYEPGAYTLRTAPVGEVRSIYPAYRYDKPDPIVHDAQDFEQELLAECARQRTSFPAGVETREAVLPASIIFDNAVYLVSEGSLVALYESCRANDRTAIEPITPQRLRRVYRLRGAGPFVFLGSPGTGNYGHWLTDDLTRATPLPQTARPPVWLLTDYGKLLNERRAASLRQALGQPSAAVRFIPPELPVFVETLRYASRPTHHPSLKSPQAIAATRRRMTAAPARSDRARRLFISRGPLAGSRTLSNFDEIAAILDRRGFSRLDPLAASAEEQTSACHAADVIVGVMGAAMTNTMFAAPGTAVVHLAPRGWVEPFYWDLAIVCDHRYQCIYGTTIGEGTLWYRSFHIDPATMVAVLNGILGQE